MPGDAQSLSGDTAQTPRSGSQHVPGGCVHRLGSQDVPAFQTPLSVPVPAGGGRQSTSWITVQAPSGWQQTPVGAAGGQASVSQRARPCHTRSGATQAAFVVSTQAPVRTSQQARISCGQGFGAQVSQSSCQIFGEKQSACVVTEQSPSETQQAPVGGCGHGFGVQVAQSACHVAVEGQSTCIVNVQVPAKTQHAPVGGAGHRFGWQVAHSWCQMPGGLAARQRAWVLIRQVPLSDQQQAPPGRQRPVAQGTPLPW
jgi:hypothetical protein